MPDPHPERCETCRFRVPGNDGVYDLPTSKEWHAAKIALMKLMNETFDALMWTPFAIEFGNAHLRCLLAQHEATVAALAAETTRVRDAALEEAAHIVIAATAADDPLPLGDIRRWWSLAGSIRALQGRHV